jgi:hypothetical protein
MTISEFFSSNFGYFGPFSSQNNFVWVTLDSFLGCQGIKNCQKRNLNFSNFQSYIHKSWDFHNLQRRIGITLSRLLTKLSLAHNKPKELHTWSCSENSKFFFPTELLYEYHCTFFYKIHRISISQQNRGFNQSSSVSISHKVQKWADGHQSELLKH